MTDDDLELRLRNGFRAGSLPGAPWTLSAALERVADVAAPTRRRGATRRRSTWVVVGLAAVLGGAGLVALVGGGRDSGLPVPSAPPAVATGARITYAVVWSEAVPASADTLAAEVRVVQRRLDVVAAGGVAAAQGTDRLEVRLPAGSDTDAVRNLIGQRGLAAFVPTGRDILEIGSSVDPSKYPALFDGAAIADATVASNGQSGQPVLRIELGRTAADAFGVYTASHIGDALAITVDGRVISNPVIKTAIPGGTLEVARGPDARWDLAATAAVLRGGPLPAPLEEISVEPGPATASDSPIGASPAPGSGSPDPSSSPEAAATPSPAPVISCAPPLRLPGELSCDAGIGAALAGLPTEHPTITRIEFSHDCQDVGIGSADCLVQAFGHVRITFDGAPSLVVEVSPPSPPRLILNPLATDGPSVSPLDADPAATCADAASSPTAMTIRISGTSIWATTSDGASLPVHFGAGFLRVSSPIDVIVLGPVGRAFGSTIVAHDGSVLVVGGSGDGSALSTCFADDGGVSLGIRKLV